jgi:hypothetical protein
MSRTIDEPIDMEGADYTPEWDSPEPPSLNPPEREIEED